MMIDCILDRYDGEPYNPRDFYFSALEYGQEEISSALDGGTSSDIKAALCAYIDRQEYNPNIKDFINAAYWLSPDNGKDWRRYVKI